MKVMVVGFALPYGVRYYQAGEVLEMPDNAAQTLIKIGRVTKVGDSVPKARRVYRRRDTEAEQKEVLTADYRHLFDAADKLE